MTLKIDGLAKYSESTCHCDRCRGMCNRPCWSTPEEAQRLIDAGHEHLLMNDWWVGGGQEDEDGYEDDIQLLCPAEAGSEGGQAPSWPGADGAKCTMLENGMCKLHDPGLKPAEGRFASCTKETPGLHHDIAQTWNNPAAQRIVQQWWEQRAEAPAETDRAE